MSMTFTPAPELIGHFTVAKSDTVGVFFIG